MNTPNPTPNHSLPPPRNWRTALVGTPLGWAVTLVLAVFGIYLFATHTGHILSALPCPTCCCWPVR